MNKSKFLKKSLAMLLAVMMVVAMIPLGASAAGNAVTVNDGTIVDLTTTAGKLEATNATAGTKPDTFTDTLNHDATGETITVLLHKNNAGGYDTVCYKLGDENVATAEKDGDNYVITLNSEKIPEKGKSVNLVVFASKGEYNPAKPVVSKNYTITLKTNTPSASWDIKEATFRPNGGDSEGADDVKGTVDNAKHTITFTTPWGVSKGAVNPVMEYPGTAIPDSDVTVGGDPVPVRVTNQVGNTITYFASATEAECLTNLTVAGVAATAKLDEETGKVVVEDGKEVYEVTLPEGTETNTEETELKEKQNIVAKIAKNKAGVTWNDDPVVSGTPLTVKVGDNTLVVTDPDKETYTKSYTVKVSVKKSNDASIKSVSVTAISEYTGYDYTETVEPTGEAITIEMPYKTDIKAAVVEVKVADGATAVVDGVTEDGTVDLSSPKRVTVTAADGKTTKYYTLSATVAENPYGKPAINAAKMTIGKEEYTATISGNTITFNGLPYATTQEDIVGVESDNEDEAIAPAKFDWGKSFGSTIITTPSGSDILFDSEDIFKNENTVTVMADEYTAVTYTVKFNLKAALTGKTLSNVSYTDAVDSDNVTVDNTYAATVASNKITTTVPYSFQEQTDKELHMSFELSEGAKLYTVEGSALADVESGFYTKEDEEAGKGTEKEPKNHKTVAVLAAETPVTYVVADETAVKLIKKANKQVTVTELDGKDYKGHVTLLTSEVKYAKAETGATLNSITDPDGKVTSKVTSAGIEITVPYSYVGNTPFFPVVSASKMAKIEPALATTKTDEPSAGYLVVAYDTEDEPVLLVLTDDSATPVDELIVTSEDGNIVNKYPVIVKVAPAKTEALVKSFKVNGTAGVINNTAKTITVNLPANSDMTAVTFEATASEMAKIALLDEDGWGIEPYDDGTEKIATAKDITFDITTADAVIVMAEDERTTNTYKLTVSVNEMKFVDVPKDWAYDGIMKAATAGVVSGYPKADGTLEFRPKNSITRGEFASMVTRLMVYNGLATQADIDACKNPFKDSNVGFQGFNSSIGYLAKNGIVSGKGSTGNFAPNDNITRQEAAMIVSKALKLQSASSTKYADDAKIADWAKTAVYQCRQAGVMVGDGKNFKPTNNLSRAEAAVTLAAKIK